MFNLRLKDLIDLDALAIGSQYPLSFVMINVLASLLCGLIIYGVYKKTYTGVLFSRNLGITMVIVSVVTSLIVMAISGNLALSLGMIGALSIIRFRTPIKDPKDTAFLFWSVTEGIVCGISAYKLALASVLFVGLCLWMLSKRIGWKSPYLLVIHSKHHSPKEFSELLKKYCSRFKERSATLSEDRAEIVYEVILKTLSHDLLKDIRAVRGVEKTIMVSYEGDLDEPR